MSYWICQRCGGGNGVVGTTIFSCHCSVGEKEQEKREPELPPTRWPNAGEDGGAEL